MKKIEAIRSFAEIKLLADSRRMDILRILMASPTTGVPAGIAAKPMI